MLWATSLLSRKLTPHLRPALSLASGRACRRAHFIPLATTPVTMSTLSTATASSRDLFIDIGANLTDSMYRGEYHGKSDVHPPDIDAVLDRAWSAGLDRIILTAGTLEEAKSALQLCSRDDRLYCTVGVHPTRCGAFDAHPDGPDAYLQDLQTLALSGKARGKVVAIGECGLDYARTQFCDVETQKKYFAVQFALSKATGLPMFLHLRDAADDFVSILSKHVAAGDLPGGGVVHSFDGDAKCLTQILANPSLSIGLNGCSLRTEENIAVAKMIPRDRVLLETDCPWCDVRSTHAGYAYVRKEHQLPTKDKKKYQADHLVKGRNEPVNILHVFDVVCGVWGVGEEETARSEVARQIHANTMRMFWPNVA